MTKQLTEERGTSAQAATCDHQVVRRWPDAAAREWTVASLEGAAANESVIAIVATGSSVRDVEYSDDLDLVLVYRGVCPEMRRPPISIDLRRYEHDDVLQRLAEGHDYLSWTVRYGRELFERRCWWTTLRTDWNERLPLPSVNGARERAEQAERLYEEMSRLGDTDAAADLQLSMLTFLARAALSEAGVFPRSRPEIPTQLNEIGERALSERLLVALQRRAQRRLAETRLRPDSSD